MDNPIPLGFVHEEQHPNTSNDAAEALAASMWTPSTGRTAFVGGIQTITSVTGNYAFEAGRFTEASMTRGLNPWGRGLIAGAALTAAEIGIDQLVFKDRPMGMGTDVADFIATPSLFVFAPMPVQYKAVAGVGLHILGRLLDKIISDSNHG